MKASELAKVLPDCEVLAIRDGMIVRILNNSIVKEIKYETYDPREQRNSNPTYIDQKLDMKIRAEDRMSFSERTQGY